ncbi:valine--tRNA ligase, partial [Hamiltosporidium magnivora]
MLALQDILIRYYRMNKIPTLYLPGTDHAGIATQTVIEKNLLLQNIHLNLLSKKEKLNLLYQHTSLYQTRIYSQIKRIGASLDFSRQKFTMDSSINKAVIHSFIILYNKNLIYRDNRLVNWCGALHTSISDLEVDNREVTPNTVIKVDKGEYLFGIMYYIDYPITECSVIGSEEDSGVIGSEEGSGVIDISKGSGVIGSEEDSGVIDISKDIVSDKDSYKSN